MFQGFFTDHMYFGALAAWCIKFETNSIEEDAVVVALF